MRIVGGIFAGRKLIAPEGRATRPTSDRVREAVFNILLHRDFGREIVTGARVLDICCGTGALGLEAVSRGATAALLIDNATAALRAAEANIAALGAGDVCRTLRADVLALGAAREAYDLVFIDPPYRKQMPERIVAGLVAGGWLASGALLVVETARDESLALPDGFAVLDQRNYGDTRVHFCTHP